LEQIQETRVCIFVMSDLTFFLSRDPPAANVYTS